MKLTPMGNDVVLRRVVVEETTTSGLYVGDMMVKTAKTCEAIVDNISKNPTRSLAVSVDDRVLVDNSTEFFKVEGVEYTVIDEGEILGVL